MEGPSLGTDYNFFLPRALKKTSFHNSNPCGQNGLDNIFKYIFMNEKFCISIRISLTFVHKGPIGNKSVSVQVIAWHRPGDKPLSVLMMVRLLMSDAYMRNPASTS